MTLTLEIAPEVEAALEKQAAQAGEPLPIYAARVLRDVAAGEILAVDSAEATRRAAIHSVKGKYAHLKSRGFSSEAIRAERNKDKVREERFNDRFGNSGSGKQAT